MPTTVTFKNLDLRDPRSVERACSILRSYGMVPSELLARTASLTLEFEEDGYTTDSTHTDTLPPNTAPTGVGDALGFYGGKTRCLLDTMLSRIRQHGSTTLGETANDMGISLDTARAYLRNAGRAAAARELDLPVKPSWNTALGCNDYVAR